MAGTGPVNGKLAEISQKKESRFVSKKTTLCVHRHEPIWAKRGEGPRVRTAYRRHALILNYYTGLDETQMNVIRIGMSLAKSPFRINAHVFKRLMGSVTKNFGPF